MLSLRESPGGDEADLVLDRPAVEHPWPMLARDDWADLAGTWEFRADPNDRGIHEHWQLTDGNEPRVPWAERIEVPFAWSSRRSGIDRPWLPIGWYRRHLRLRTLPGRRTVIVFAAVHHRASVWADGLLLIDHRGGSERFECDLTASLADAPDGVDLVVRVEAPVDKRRIPHGKQRSIPLDGFDPCCFTPTSGIWQPVWLEQRPLSSAVRRVDLIPTETLDGFRVDVEISGQLPAEVEIEFDSGEREMREIADVAGTLTVPLRTPQIWSPKHPHLYRVTVRARPVGLSADGADGRAATDVVTATAGLRRFEIRDGVPMLNGTRCYLRGVLDQGYWPDSGLTAPSLEALATDLDLAAAAGFTLVRKHLTFTDPRQIAMADARGLLVWVEPPSYSEYSSDGAVAFRDQVEEMVRRYINHPSVILYGLYNEEWGFGWQVAERPEFVEEIERVVRLARSLDPSRPVIDNSGWCHVDTDVADWHVYTADLHRWRRELTRVTTGSMDVLEVGTTAYETRQRPFFVTPSDPARTPMVMNSEYGVGLTSLERAWHLKWQTLIMREFDANHGYIYCEIADIEHETAGIVTDHRVPKELGSLRPADVNADTVVIPGIEPIEPGVDLVLGADPPATVPVRVSHHGPTPITVQVLARWRDVVPASASGSTTDVPVLIVEPFRCSDAVAVPLPPWPAGTGLTSRVLELVAIAGERQIAVTPVDVIA